MKVKAFLALFLLAASFLSAREEEVFDYPLSGATRPQFLAVCGELSRRPVIRGSFEQEKRLNRLGRSLISRGIFTIAGAYGMIWETQQPYPSVMAIGRDFILQETSPGNRTRLDAGGNETFLRLADTISAIFTGNAGRLLDNFDVFYTQRGETWTAGLIPRESSIQSFAESIVLSGVTPGPGRDTVIGTILLSERNGDAIMYSLGGHSFSTELNPREASFFEARD